MENKEIILYDRPGLRARITLEQCKINFEKGGSKACSVCPEPLFQKGHIKNAIVVTKDRGVETMSNLSGYDKNLIVNLGWLLAANKIPAKGQTLEAVYHELLRHGFTRDEIIRCKQEGPKTFVTKIGECMSKKFTTRQDIIKLVGFEVNTLKNVYARLIETNLEKGPEQGASGEAYLEVLKYFTKKEFVEAWEKCRKGGEGYELQNKPLEKEIVRPGKTYKPVSFINPDKGSLAVPVMAKASLQLASLETAPGILSKVKNAYTEVKKANNALENKKSENLQYFIEKIVSLLPVGVSITITGKQV